MESGESSPASSDKDVEVDDLDVVQMDEMDVVDCESDCQCEADLDESPILFTPPRDDAVAVFDGHKESVFCVAFDPAGKLLASGGQDHVAIVWDIPTKQPVFTTIGHQDSVTHIAFSPDGTYLATGDMAGDIRVWLRPTTCSSISSDSGQWRLLLSESIGDLKWLCWWKPPSVRNVTSNAASPSPAVLAAGDEDGLVAIWSVKPSQSPQDNQTKAKYFGGAGFSALCGTFYLPSISSDRPKLVVLYHDSVLRLWDLKTEEILTSVRLIPACVTETETGVRDEQPLFCLSQPHPATEALHQQTDLVVVGGMNRILAAVIKLDKHTNSFTSKVLQPIELNDCGSVEALDFSWTHPFFAFGTVSGFIGIVDAHLMRLRHGWTYSPADDESGDSAAITGLLWSPTRPIVFTSTSNGAIIAWPGLSGSMEPVGSGISTPTPMQIWWGHKAMILALALSVPYDQLKSDQTCDKQTADVWIASGSDDTTVRIYSTNSLVNCSH